MRIGGFQKLSLLDFPGKIACVVFTQGCLFRCAYCHNPKLIPLKFEGGISEEEVFSYLAANTKMLEGVCISGGEPTMHADLPDLMRKIKKLGLAVKLDTNGVNPAMVRAMLKERLLDYIAMDLKHMWKKYADVIKTQNKKAIANCRKTFAMIQNSGVDHEFRTTVFPGVHTEKDFLAMAGYLKPGEKYFLQNIRYEATLDPDISKDKVLDVDNIVSRLRRTLPKLVVGTR